MLCLIYSPTDYYNNLFVIVLNIHHSLSQEMRTSSHLRMSRFLYISSGGPHAPRTLASVPAYGALQHVPTECNSVLNAKWMRNWYYFFNSLAWWTHNQQLYRRLTRGSSRSPCKAITCSISPILHLLYNIYVHVSTVGSVCDSSPSK